MLQHFEEVSDPDPYGGGGLRSIRGGGGGGG